MCYYEPDGSQRPLMLSELIENAQKALAKYGNMIVWVEVLEVGEWNEVHSEPAECYPTVDIDYKAKQNACWSNRDYKNSFVIEG